MSLLSGHFRRLNPAWERTLGFTLKELMSRPFIEFMHPDDRERTLAQNAQVRAGAHAQLVSELKAALREVKTLREILSICAYCKKIRGDENDWHSVESYISRHTTTQFSHGICPSCMETEVEAHFEAFGRD